MVCGFNKNLLVLVLIVVFSDDKVCHIRFFLLLFFVEAGLRAWLVLAVF